jgi:hypothetical protein
MAPRPDMAKRHEYEARKRMKAHGATGRPSDLAPLEAIALGICPLCSGHWTALHLHIADHYPYLSRGQGRSAFLQAVGLPEDTSLMTDVLRESCRQGQLRRMRGPQGERIRKNLAKRAKGNQSHRAGVPSWPIVRLIGRGMTAAEAWKTLKLGAKITPHGVGQRARDYGFTFGTEAMSDQCEPYTYERLYHLRRVSGFEIADFDRCAGLDEGRSDGTCPGDRIVGPDQARKAIAWRDEVLTALLNVQPLLVVARHEYRKDELLLTFLPELAETNRALVASLGEIRQDVRNHAEWGVEELGESMCMAAAREQSIEGNLDHSRRKTLRYLCEEKSEVWLAANLERLRANEDDGPLVRELTGSRYGATQWIVQHALRPRAHRITSLEVRMLIKEFAPQLAEEKIRRGRPEGSNKVAASTEWFKTGRAVEDEVMKFGAVFEKKAKLADEVRRNFSRCADALEKFGFGRAESEAAAANGSATEAARDLVCQEKRPDLDRDSVVAYHKRFLRFLRETPKQA